MKTLTEVQSWRGMTMIDADGDKIGTIEDILLDRQNGEPMWAAVKTGLFGHKHTFVPIRDAMVTDKHEVRVSLQKETVKNAPRIDPRGELSPEKERELWEYYGFPEYDEWQGEDRTRNLGLPDEDEDRARQQEVRTQAGQTEAPGGAPAVVGVRLRRVVVVGVFPEGREPDSREASARPRQPRRV